MEETIGYTVLSFIFFIVFVGLPLWLLNIAMTTKCPKCGGNMENNSYDHLECTRCRYDAGK